MPQQSILNKELIDLCTRVSSQADDYSKLFLDVRHRVNELEGLRSDLQGVIKTFKAQASEEFLQSRSKVDQGLSKLTAEMEFVRKIFGEMDHIHVLRDELTLLRTTFNDRIVEMDTVINSIRTYVEKETTDQFVEFERRLSLKIDGFDAIFGSLENRLAKLQDLLESRHNGVTDELDRLKARMSDLKRIVDDASRKFNQLLEDADTRLTETVKRNADELERKVNDKLDLLPKEGTLKQRIDRLRIDTQALERRISEFDRSVAVRATIAMWLSIAAVVGLFAIVIF